MKYKFFMYLALAFACLFAACSKEKLAGQGAVQNDGREGSAMLAGAVQVSGIGFFDATDACGSAGQEAAYAITMTGDLEGCLYTFVDEYECSPSGTYREVGREYFVGTYLGEAGSFWTEYKFEAKYEGCNADGSYFGLEIFGRCQHPVVKGSGEGVFEGVTGRVDFKDNIEDGNYPYRGHFAFK